MAENTLPTFPKAALSWAARLATANVSSEGDGTIGTTMQLLGTGGTNDTFLPGLTIMPAASSPTSTVATVIRLFICDIASGSPTSANCHLIAEIEVPIVAAANASSQVSPRYVPLNTDIPAGKSLLATTHNAAAANTSWRVTAQPKDY